MGLQPGAILSRPPRIIMLPKLDSIEPVEIKSPVLFIGDAHIGAFGKNFDRAEEELADFFLEKGKDCAQAMCLTLTSLFQFQGQIKRERVGEGVCGVCCGLNFFIRPVFFPFIACFKPKFLLQQYC